tara:strand:- start:29327 stop:30412 length:1086 start_codon:yes stop_codon:yes gene_type:complete
MELDDEWEKYFNDETSETVENNNNIPNNFIPKCSEIYISTRTKTGALDKEIDLEDVFWKLPIVPYHEQREGIIKKIIKINSKNEEEVKKLEEKLNTQRYSKVDILSQVNTITGKIKKFKDIRKITIGMSKKDLINVRKKKKSAFYNCFSIILRIKYKDTFKEINIKLFNTGKLKIPGIKELETLNISVNYLVNTINKITDLNVKFLEKKVETVLINSNFNCNFYIIRNKLHDILKYKYNIHSLFDPCSYPGIQCKFFYNKENLKNNGVCCCKEKCEINNKKKKKINKCKIISFMVFRTGSILIVGNCDENILKIIYNFIVNILITESKNDIISKIISDNEYNAEKEEILKYRKQYILVSSK